MFKINKGVYYENFHIGTNCTNYGRHAIKSSGCSYYKHCSSSSCCSPTPDIPHSRSLISFKFSRFVFIHIFHRTNGTIQPFWNQTRRTNQLKGRESFFLLCALFLSAEEMLDGLLSSQTPFSSLFDGGCGRSAFSSCAAMLVAVGCLHTARCSFLLSSPSISPLRANR